MTAELRLSADFALPLDAVTETFGILAKKRAGKSNAAVVMAEAMWDAGVPWVAVDPKGDWWGLRSSGDGRGPGLPLVVFGGTHGDLPLEPTAGALIADLVIDLSLTCVLDVSEFTKADTNRFLVAFADRLYRRAGDEPLHLFLEEAHEYLPQMVRGEDAKVVAAWQKIVKQGGFKGLGCTLVSQRSASLNKDVLTQVDTLIVLRTTSPQDRAAVKAWVDVHAASAEMMNELPSLADGQAWIWSPEFLGQLVKIRFRRRRTFDSGATPKVGQARRPPATLADVDLGAIKDAMADTIERAKADDPAELRKRIRGLERQLAAQPAVEPQIVEVEVVVEKPVVPAEFVERFDELAQDVTARLAALADYVHTTARAAAQAPAAEPARRAARAAPAKPAKPAPARPAAPVDLAAVDAGLSKAERAVLSVLAQHPDGRSRVQLALLTGYSVKSSSLANALGRLRSLGYVTKGGEPIQATDVGVASLGDFEPLPTGEDLYRHWQTHLGKAERAVLDAFRDAYPDELDREQLAIVTGYSSTSSSLANALGRLRSLELVVGWRASDDFMESVRG